jgi:hypothetical protein
MKDGSGSELREVRKVRLTENSGDGKEGIWTGEREHQTASEIREAAMMGKPMSS